MKKKVPAPPRSSSAPGRTTFRYRPQYGLVVVCADEADQRQTFDRLQKIGLKPKVVVV